MSCVGDDTFALLDIVFVRTVDIDELFTGPVDEGIDGIANLQVQNRNVFKVGLVRCKSDGSEAFDIVHKRSKVKVVAESGSRYRSIVDKGCF